MILIIAVIGNTINTFICTQRASFEIFFFQFTLCCNKIIHVVIARDTKRNEYKIAVNERHFNHFYCMFPFANWRHFLTSTYHSKLHFDHLNQFYHTVINNLRNKHALI